MKKIFAVADYIISKEDSLTTKKLQKLCYYVDVFSYGIFNKSLTNSEFEAWIHGPVNRDLFYKYQGNYKVYNSVFDSEALTEKEQKIIDLVLSLYGSYSGDQLEEFTHNEAPWKNARKGYRDRESCNVPLSLDDIKTLGDQLIKYYS